MNTEQLELQNRIKLLMEYDMKHTLSENTKLILEIGIPGWVKTLSKNVLDDVVSNTGGVLKTIGGKSVSSSDDLLKVLGKTGKNSLDDISKQLLSKSLLKNASIPFSQKNLLIKGLTDDSSIIAKYSKSSNKQIFNDFKKKGYPDDVSKTIADKLKPGQSTPKPNAGGKTNTGGNVDDVFLTNSKQMYADLKNTFPKASSSDIANLAKSIKQGIPTSQKAYEALFEKVVKIYKPNYLKQLQVDANKLTYWEKYLALPKKYKIGLVILAGFGSCQLVVPVFGTDCSTLAAKLINTILSGTYNTAKQIKNPGTTPETPETTPETITTEAQLRAKYPCVNGEAGVRFSPITNNKCTVTFSNGESYELTINVDKGT